MLASEFRLKKSRDISRVFKRGRYGGREVQVKAAINGLELSRAVVVVSKKISKKAVVRNRLRRRISGVLEANWKTVKPGYDIVITVREDVSDTSADQLRQTVEFALDRAGVSIGEK